MKAVVTGGAGFIGANLVEYLVKRGHEVVIIDNLSSGRYEFIRDYVESGEAEFIRADLAEPGDWVRGFEGADVVYHLAANPEVKTSIVEPGRHFRDNVLVTFNALEASRKAGVGSFVFASSSTVYGDADVFPTPEDYEPKEPISVYGGAKLAAEDLVKTWAKVYGLRSLILRFANVVGPKQTHGVIVDFIHKLLKNPRRLEILGDGTQRKSYIHVNDLIAGMERCREYLLRSGKEYEIFNLGNRDWVTVREIADIVVEVMGLRDVEYVYRPATPDGRGWKGDVKFMLLDISKAMKLAGWEPSMSSADALRDAARRYLETVRGD